MDARTSGSVSAENLPVSVPNVAKGCSSRGSPSDANSYDSRTTKDSALSFPIKRSSTTLQDPPSVFEKSQVSERSGKNGPTKYDLTSAKRSRTGSSTSRNEDAGQTCKPDNESKSGDDEDRIGEDNERSSSKEPHRFHKRKRKDKDRKKSTKKRSEKKTEEDKKNRKRKHKKTPKSETLVAAYSSDNEDSCPPKRSSPATLPRAHAASSPTVHSERTKPPTSTRSPPLSALASVTKVTKTTAKSTWDSSDSDFEGTLTHPSTAPAAAPSPVSPRENATANAEEVHGVPRRRSHSRRRSYTGSSTSASSFSSCSSRRRSYSSRSYSSRQRRSYSSSTPSSRSSRSSSRSYSRRRRGRRRGHRRHGRRRHRHSSTRSSYSRSSYSRSSSRGRGSRRRRRYSRSGDSYRRRSSYRSYSSRSRHGRYTSSDRSQSPNSRDTSRTPPPSRSTASRRSPSGVVTAAVVVSPSECRLSRPLGNKNNLIRGHKPSEAIAAAASAAVRKITGRTEPSPPSTPPTLPKIEESHTDEPNKKAEADEEDSSNYIGPQVPPDMAKKLGLKVSSSPPPKLTSGVSTSTNNWKAHVGAKRKSEKVVNESVKKQEDSKSEFMTPPEKDEQYKALQEQAKEHVRQQLQQAHFQASQQQQQLAAAAAVASAAAVQPSVTAPTTMFHAASGQLSLVDQLRQRQQLYFMAGATTQAMVLEGLIRQHQQAEAATILQQHQQQQALQILALQHQQQQTALLAVQQQQAQQHQVQSAQQAALLLAAQQHQAAAVPQADSANAAAMAVAQQQQQAVLQSILHQRQQMTPTAATVCSLHSMCALL
uniref:Protein kinase domain-containing protein n=1 Tax=Mesocestoides corti TaxID=53468 RepID=A0A5K3FMG0_MESCO